MTTKFKRFTRFTFWGIGLSIVAGLAAVIGLLAVIFAMVQFGDNSQLKKTTILSRINEETGIYMLDEETQIGSIFDSGHRQYVPIDDVPANMINAIIASEDKNFYEHGGVDPVAIFSAGMGWLKGGRIRGASTLTQQTVRNILNWWEVSLARKFREWIAAMQLERLYDKRQILEFYLNQFYVSGNGNGIGIAAKYYFNKDVRDLDLVESAFIAGSVKGPSSYDPFIKFTKKSRDRAVQRAFNRKNYVLRRMFEQGWISEDDLKQAWEAPVQFNRGRFRTDEVALVQLIRSEMNKSEILEALGIDDPRELANAGLKIFTTIDGELQDGSQLAMRRNLSRLATMLEGFAPEDGERYKALRSLQVGDFYYGKVLEVGGTAKEPSLRLDFGLPKGTVPFESMMRYAKIMDLPYGAGWQKKLAELRRAVEPGDTVFVEVREYDPESHEAVVELQKRPTVNGGMIALDKGEVRAVVSGFDTKGFNRAITARRQPGSVFKPVVYFAAMQLGWSILDRLDNEPQIFPYQGQFYYPRPDHTSPYGETSVLWSGITSENLASVALAARLMEKLNFNQFKELLSSLGLAPLPDEKPRDYHYRIARAVGVQLNNRGVREFQLENATQDLLLDIQYTTTQEFRSRLEKIWWGRGYQQELQAIYKTESTDLSPSRKARRIELLLTNRERLSNLNKNLEEDWQTLSRTVDQQGFEQAFRDPSIQHIIDRFHVLPGREGQPELGYQFRTVEEEPGRDAVNPSEVNRLLEAPGRALSPLDMQAIWAPGGFFMEAAVKLEDVNIDSWLPKSYFEALERYTTERYQEVGNRSEPYDLHRYWQHHDFRIGLGLHYLVELTKAMGVESPLEPILSFPLGTNIVSVAEVAKVYQTFQEGKIYRYYEDGPPNQLNFIRRIEDREGNVLFEPKRQEIQLVKPEFAAQMGEVLRRVVTHGTGRRARGELYVTLGDDGTR